MKDNNNDYIFIVDLTIYFKDMPLETINSKRIFHFKNKKIVYTSEKYDAAVILLEIDEKDISKKIDKKNILRINFELKDCDFETHFESHNLSPIILLVYSIRYHIILSIFDLIFDSIKFWKDKTETSEGKYFYLLSTFTVPGSFFVNDNTDYINLDSESIRNRVIEKRMFFLLNDYLRKNARKFFDIKQPTFLSLLKELIKGIFK